MDHVVDQVDLPLSGLSAEIVLSPVGLLYWRLLPTTRVAKPLERTPILGWWIGCPKGVGASNEGEGGARTQLRRRSLRYTVAWGSLLGGRGPLRVAVVRDRWMRTALRRVLQPITLRDVFWIAEVHGRYDRLVVSDGSIVESRELSLPHRPA